MSRQPFLREIAQATNVSIATVSLVLNERPGISEKTRQRVHEVATKLGYDWNGQKSVTRTDTIALLIEHSSMPILGDVFYGDVVSGIQSECKRLGYQVLLHMYNKERERLDEVCTELAESTLGLVIANDGDITPEMVVQLEASDVPLVLIENHIEGHHLPTILGDNFTAGYTVMRHLISLGHTRIAVIRGPNKYSSLVDQLRGCLSAAAEADIHIPDELMPIATSKHPYKGYLQMKRVLARLQQPSAVVAISDKTAFGAIGAITEAGLRIPKDISLVSIDNVADSIYTQPAADNL